MYGGIVRTKRKMSSKRSAKNFLKISRTGSRQRKSQMTKVLNLHEWKSDNILRKLSKIGRRRDDILLDLLSLRRQEHKNIQEIPGDKNLELRSGLKLWESVTGRLLIEEQSGRQSLGSTHRKRSVGDEGQREEVEITEWFIPWKSN